MASIARPWRWLICLLPLSVAIGAEPDDRVVLETVLEHFGARRDAHFYDESATLAIAPITKETAGSDSDYRYLNQGEGHCGIPRSLYVSLRKRNMTAVAATALVSASPLWRIVDDEEANAIGGWQFGGRERDPVKTLVTLTKPGYATDGNSAFVNLSFLWSVHGAEARYVLKRAGSAWEVACSHLVFYV